MKSRAERIANAELCNHTLTFPDITTFDGLFAEVYPDKESAPGNHATEDGYHTGLSSWVRRSQQGDHIPSLYARLKPEVLKQWHAGLVVPGTLYLEIIDRGDNESLVISQYDQIIGSRWMAFIETDSIPKAQS